MNFEAACTELQRLLAAGTPAFQSLRRYTAADLSAFEQQAGVRFPASYRQFLQQVGACRCYWERGVGIEFLALEHVAEFTAQACGEGVTPPPALWLAASSSFSGELAGFDLARSSADNFAVFLPDGPPEQWLTDTEGWQPFENWLTDTEGWQPFENWLTALVASGGEDFLQ